MSELGESPVEQGSVRLWWKFKIAIGALYVLLTFENRCKHIVGVRVKSDDVVAVVNAIY